MLTKICLNSKCGCNGRPQPLSNFHKDKSRKDGYRDQCKSCIKEYTTKYNEENRDKINERNIDYYKNNKESINIYRKKNKEKRQRYNTKYAESLSLYNIFYNKINIYEEVRQDPDNPKLLQVRCLYCGSWFNPTNNEIKKRIGAINGEYKGESRLYCSDGCKESCPIYRTQTIRKDLKKKENSNEVNPEFRKMVLERDNWTCQKCEKTKDDGGSLHCHHINPRITDPMLDCDLDNGITLCKSCHIEVHKQPGCGNRELRCEIKI